MLQKLFEDLICAAGLLANVPAAHIQLGGDLFVTIPFPEVHVKDLSGDGIDVLEGELDRDVWCGDLKLGRRFQIVGQGELYVLFPYKVDGLVVCHGEEPLLRRIDIFPVLHIQKYCENFLCDVLRANGFSETNVKM